MPKRTLELPNFVLRTEHSALVLINTVLRIIQSGSSTEYLGYKGASLHGLPSEGT